MYGGRGERRMSMFCMRVNVTVGNAVSKGVGSLHEMKGLEGGK